MIRVFLKPLAFVVLFLEVLLLAEV